MGKVYILHFEQAYEHAKHYTGYSDNFAYRLNHHRNGTGAKLMKVVVDKGIRFVVASLTDGTRHDERRIKVRGATRICPVCKNSLHVCFECGKLYKTERNYRKHLAIKHKGVSNED